MQESAQSILQRVKTMYNQTQAEQIKKSKDRKMLDPAGRRRRRAVVAHPASQPGDYSYRWITWPAGETGDKRLLHCLDPLKAVLLNRIWWEMQLLVAFKPGLWLF